MEGMENVSRLPEYFRLSLENCLKGVTIRASAEKSFFFFYSKLFKFAPAMVPFAIRRCRRFWGCKFMISDHDYDEGLLKMAIAVSVVCPCCISWVPKARSQKSKDNLDFCIIWYVWMARHIYRHLIDFHNQYPTYLVGPTKSNTFSTLSLTNQVCFATLAMWLPCMWKPPVCYNSPEVLNLKVLPTDVFPRFMPNFIEIVSRKKTSSQTTCTYRIVSANYFGFVTKY